MKDLDLLKGWPERVKTMQDNWIGRSEGLEFAFDFPAIGELVRGAKRYYLQCFTDRDSVPFEGLSAPGAEELARYAEIMRDYVAAADMRGVE